MAKNKKEELRRKALAKKIAALTAKVAELDTLDARTKEFVGKKDEREAEVQKITEQLEVQRQMLEVDLRGGEPISQLIADAKRLWQALYTLLRSCPEEEAKRAAALREDIWKTVHKFEEVGKMS